MARGAKMMALAGESKKVLVIAVFALHPGKAAVQVTAQSRYQ
jgi:hypothetical protein